MLPQTDPPAQGRTPGGVYHPDPDGPIVFLGRRYRVATPEDLAVFGARLGCPVDDPLTRDEAAEVRRRFRAQGGQGGPGQAQNGPGQCQGGAGQNGSAQEASS